MRSARGEFGAAASSRSCAIRPARMRQQLHRRIGMRHARRAGHRRAAAGARSLRANRRHRSAAPACTSTTLGLRRRFDHRLQKAARSSRACRRSAAAGRARRGTTSAATAARCTSASSSIAISAAPARVAGVDDQRVRAHARRRRRTAARASRRRTRRAGSRRPGRRACATARTAAAGRRPGRRSGLE